MKTCETLTTTPGRFVLSAASLLLAFSAGCSTHIQSPADLAFDHLLQGDAYYKRSNYPAALQEYRTAISLSPNDWPAHSKAGQVLEQEGRLQEAIVEYRKVIAINYPVRNPADKAYWHFRLAGALSHAGLRQEAGAEYATSYQIASHDQMHKKKLALLASQSLHLSRVK